MARILVIRSGTQCCCQPRAQIVASSSSSSRLLWCWAPLLLSPRTYVCTRLLLLLLRLFLCSLSFLLQQSLHSCAERLQPFRVWAFAWLLALGPWFGSSVSGLLEKSGSRRYWYFLCRLHNTHRLRHFRVSCRILQLRTPPSGAPLFFLLPHHFHHPPSAFPHAAAGLGRAGRLDPGGPYPAARG